MKNNQDDWGYWAGWVIAFCLAAAFFVYNLWHGSSLRGAVCKPEEADCFRQWVSALGGWAAVAAAVPTIFYLSRQVSDASKNHREMVQLQTAPKYILAKHVLAIAKLSKQAAEKDVRYWETFEGSVQQFRMEGFARLQSIRDDLIRNDITKFNEEIGYTTSSAKAICDMLEKYCSILLNEVDISVDDATRLANNIKKTCTVCVVFFSEIGAAAKAYIDSVENLSQI